MNDKDEIKKLKKDLEITNKTLLLILDSLSEKSNQICKLHFEVAKIKSKDLNKKYTWKLSKDE